MRIAAVSTERRTTVWVHPQLLGQRCDLGLIRGQTTALNKDASLQWLSIPFQITNFSANACTTINLWSSELKIKIAPLSKRDEPFTSTTITATTITSSPSLPFNHYHHNNHHHHRPGHHRQTHLFCLKCSAILRTTTINRSNCILSFFSFFSAAVSVLASDGCGTYTHTHTYMYTYSHIQNIQAWHTFCACTVLIGTNSKIRIHTIYNNYLPESGKIDTNTLVCLYYFVAKRLLRTNRFPCVHQRRTHFHLHVVDQDLE